MKHYLLEVDETYKIDGTRTFYTFYDKDEAVQKYHEHWRGMVNLMEVEVHENGNQTSRLLEDEAGRKYVKGSPFYSFPHVPHRSKIDGSEILST